MKWVSFNDEQVRAVLAGIKTQTRLPVEPQPRKGFTVECTTCGKTKSPSGRSLPPYMAMDQHAFCGDLLAIEGTPVVVEITSVRYERLQEIDEDDAFAEGVEGAMGYKRGDGPWNDPEAIAEVERLWDAAYGDTGYSWVDNPFVWVIEFKLKEQPVMVDDLKQAMGGK